MPNYNYVIDSSFKPFSLQEMMTPWLMYSNAAEKAEEDYEKLSAMEKFKDLVSREGEEEAAEVYNNFADEYDKQRKDFSDNGLNLGNRRGLMELKRRYKKEIGALEEAEKKYNEEMKYRQDMRAKGLHMLYNNDNLTISSYLHGNTPNQYGISTDELYSKGSAAGKAFTSRMFDSYDGGEILKGYYRKWCEQQGINPDKLNTFQQEMMLNGFKSAASSIPELQAVAKSGLEGLGVYDNLKGNNLRQAELNYLNGMIDGAVFKIDTKPIEDKSKMSAGEAARLAEAQRQYNMDLILKGVNPKTGEFNPEKSLDVLKARAVQEAKNGGKAGSGSGGSKNGRYTQLPKSRRIEWDDDPTEAGAKYKSKDLDVSPSSETEHEGRAMTYDELPQYAKDMVDAQLGPEGNVDLHMYYFQPYVDGGIWNDQESVLEIVPLKTAVYNGESSDMDNDTELEG